MIFTTLASLLVLHLDFNTIQMKRETVVSVLRTAAECGYNAILWEIENKVKWRTCPVCVHPEAFSKEEFREILGEAKSLGLKSIPLLQTFGHAEYILLKAHPEWREKSSDPACYCVSRPEVRAFLRDMVREYLEVFGPVEEFHLGGDEVAALGTCPVCSKRNRMDLYAEHLLDVSADLRAKGVRPGIWCDMILSEKDATQTAKIPRDFTVWHWDYTYDGKSAIKDTAWSGKFRLLQDLGFDVVFCPSSASYMDGPFLVRYGSHADNLIASADLARRESLHGLCVTSWSIRQSTKMLQAPLWRLAAKRYLNPAPLATVDEDEAYRCAFGAVGRETIRNLTDWTGSLCPLDGRDWMTRYKPAIPAPPGELQKIVLVRERKNPAYRAEVLSRVRMRQAAVEKSLAAVRASEAGQMTDALLEGGELTRTFLREAESALLGREAGDVPRARTCGFYSEQTSASAANSSDIVWSVLSGR